MSMASHFIQQQSSDCLRTKAAKAALDHVIDKLTPSSVIGIGTGATVEVFIKLLKSSGAEFSYCVSSSERSSKALREAGLPEIAIADCERVDFYIDGIDEGLSNGITVKGGGAALAREKVLATLALTFITIADSGRMVSELGKFPLPIEVLPAAQKAVSNALQSLGGTPALRQGCTTDNGNIILDVAGLNLSQPSQIEQQLNAIPGVVENGIFSHRKADFMAFSSDEGVHWLAR
ncbi:ribose-5-phosphate isomerase RpiA [Vibrio sp. SCSIO 43135]|uniref:ribose-5-phosphate isomerase RpiA n=1 Tax=Vibrio sp. SCSIO 43135 TaxID=2819096 RepID=UPI0020762FC0|nr:ribose-5-phosphate isomerase RpiA [Vibrio sp. SCSIO 43135]USD43318.1 ribose-5-phosphate isomerase RpiA [Vibrio sp. SCSIO 43135]